MRMGSEMLLRPPERIDKIVNHPSLTVVKNVTSFGSNHRRRTWINHVGQKPGYNLYNN